jgi:hypothetical protein
LLGNGDQHGGAAEVQVQPAGNQHIVEAPEHELFDEMPGPAPEAAMWTPSHGERCSLDRPPTRHGLPRR